jgi:cytochrome c peroxidase
MKVRLVTLLLLLLVVFTGCESSIDKQALLEKAKLYFKPLPDKMPGSENDTEALIALGKDLYFEKGLSANGEQSCNTCHSLDQGKAGVDNEATSPGVKGERGDRNSPTVLNAGFHTAQFWDGRAKDLVEQAGGPILNPVEMAMKDSAAVEAFLRQSDVYQARFKTAFADQDDPISYTNLTLALAAFERTLITRDRFDDFLNGDLEALTEEESRGLEVFISSNCITCHNGPTIGGNLYQKSGLVNAYKHQSDIGRFAITEKDGDKFYFKVPSLRNIALTAPYFHDGKIRTLAEAVKEMGWMQIGMELTDAEVESIVTFLHALSDKEISAKRKS